MMHISLYIMVLATSVLGSLHCVGMCGPIVSLYSGDLRLQSMRQAHLSYHGARLISYCLLGAAAGVLGASLDLGGRLVGIEEAAALIAGTLIVAWGSAQLLDGLGWFSFPSESPSWGGLYRYISRRLARFYSLSPSIRAGLLGFVSAFLPCGWLFGFITTAASTGHPVSGGLVMAAFWAGTVPGLLGAAKLIRVMAHYLGPQLRWVMPCMLICLGLTTVWVRSSLMSDGERPPCHLHKKVGNAQSQFN